MNKTNTEAEARKNASAETDNLLEIRMDDFLRGLIKYWWVCVLCALLGAAVMFVRSYVRFVPVYQCSATFTVQTQQAGAAGDSITSYSFSYNRSAAAQLSNTFPSIIKSNILQDIIKNDLELSYMPATLSASSVSGTNMFTISAKGYDPELTYQVLLSAIRNYPAVAEYVIGNTNLYMLAEPILPTTPSNALSYRTQILRGALFGLALGLAWVALYAFQRCTVRSRADIRQKLNQHCIGTLPYVRFKKHRQEINRSVLLTNPLLGDGYMESFRAIRNSLAHNNTDQRVIMVTSTAPGEGKTTTAVNLAIALSRMHLKVLLVDADLRSPSVNEMVGLPTDSKPEGNPPYFFAALPNTSVTVMNFDSGSRKLWQIIRVDYLRRLFGELRTKYDYVIVDTSPCGLTAEPAIIAQSVDAALVVIRQDTVRISRIQACIDTLLNTKVDVLGCIFNCVSAGLAGYGGKYGYGYGYGYGREYGAEKKKEPVSSANPANKL